MCPFPLTSIPTLPAAGNCCLWQIHKKAVGQRKVDWQAPYPCATGTTRRGVLSLELALFTFSAPCDQNPGLVPDNSLVRARGIVIRREDGLADFASRFNIITPAGAIIFRGHIELLDRIGTHHDPFGPEPCNPESHIEGWLVGLGEGAMVDWSLRVQFVARGQLPAAAGPFAVEGLINGVLARCP